MGSADEIGKKRWPCCVPGRWCVRAHFIGKCVGCKSLVLAVGLVMLARQAAAAVGRRGGEALGGGDIRSAVHLRYLGHVADEQVECDVPANMRG